MRRIPIVLGGLLWCSCADVGTTDAHDEAPTRSVAAPFVFAPAFDRMVLHDVVVDGHALGDLAIEGVALEAVGGRLDGVRAREHGGIVVPEAEHDDALALATVDAELVGIELIGVEAAWQGDGQAMVLGESLTVEAIGFSWDDPGSRLVLLDDAEGTAAGAGSSAPSPRIARRQLVQLELAHALAGDDTAAPADLLGVPGDEPPSWLAMGEVCTDSELCDEGLQCLGNPTDFPDGMARCLPACVPAPSTLLLCTDDVSCCDPTAVCSDEGVCVVAGDGGGSGGGGGGCASSDCDDDDDGVGDAIDQNPDQSCSADADDDGCKDSCDEDDTDGGCSSGSGGEGNGFCSAGRGRMPRPNALSVAFVVLVMLRGRRRR